jgi:hypothetical protein
MSGGQDWAAEMVAADALNLSFSWERQASRLRDENLKLRAEIDRLRDDLFDAEEEIKAWRYLSK